MTRSGFKLMLEPRMGSLSLLLPIQPSCPVILPWFESHATKSGAVSHRPCVCMCVCVRVCVCERERERDKERDGERDGVRDRQTDRLLTWVAHRLISFFPPLAIRKSFDSHCPAPHVTTCGSPWQDDRTGWMNG